MEDLLAVDQARKLFEEYKKTKDPSLLDQAIKLLEGRKCLSCLNQLGLIYTEKGELDKAIKCFKEALKRSKSEEDSSIIKFNMAIAYYRSRDLQSSYEILRELSSGKSSIKTHAQRLLAKVCLSFGDIKHVDEARAILESFDEPTEDLVVAYIFLARNGRKEYLRNAIENAKLLGNKRLLAEAYLSSDNVKDLEKALELFRDIGDVRGEARALYKLSQYKPELLYEALQKLEESGEGTDSDKVRLLNELYKRTGILDFLKQAIKYGEKAKEYLFLARAYVELAKHENEVENLRRAVKYYEEFIKERFSS